MDFSILARDVANLLIPALPFLAGIGQAAAGKLVGEAVSETAKKLWAKLHPKVESKPATMEAIQDVASHPDDEDAQASFRFQIKKLLADDSELAKELSAMIDEAKHAGATVVASGERSVGIGGNVTGSSVITGDNNTVQRGKYNIKIDKASGLAIGDGAQVIPPDDEDDE